MSMKKMNIMLNAHVLLQPELQWFLRTLITQLRIGRIYYGRCGVGQK